VLLVATDPTDGIIGYTAVRPEDGEMFLLFVDPAHAGRGVGRMLLAAAHDALRAAGCTGATYSRTSRTSALWPCTALPATSPTARSVTPSSAEIRCESCDSSSGSNPMRFDGGRPARARDGEDHTVGFTAYNPDPRLCPALDSS
jgi:Acetyltransferase (GNAT) domain